MNRILFSTSAILLALGSVSSLLSTANADPPENLLMPSTAPPVSVEMSGPVTPTPEMWLYLQERDRHDNPKLAVRRKAEERAAARRARLAAMKWYGMSNQRPQASPAPFMGTYSPTWFGNSNNLYGWVPGRRVPRVTVNHYEVERR